MRIYMAYSLHGQDRGRITVRTAPFTDVDFPLGAADRGEVWPQRQLDIPDQTWTKMLKGTFSPDSQDRQHRKWWDDAAPEGAPAWPDLPGETVT